MAAARPTTTSRSNRPAGPRHRGADPRRSALAPVALPSSPRADYPSDSLSLDAIHTDRLLGERPDAAAHREFLVGLFGDPAVAATLWPGGLGGPRTPEQVDGILDRDVAHWRQHRFGPWVFSERETGVPVGRGGLQHTVIAGRDEVEVLYAIAPSRWGRGYATEIARSALAAAAELPQLTQVVAFTLTANRASRSVMEKAGLVFAGPVEHAGLPHVLHQTAV